MPQCRVGFVGFLRFRYALARLFLRSWTGLSGQPAHSGESGSGSQPPVAQPCDPRHVTRSIAPSASRLSATCRTKSAGIPSTRAHAAISSPCRIITATLPRTPVGMRRTVCLAVSAAVSIPALIHITSLSSWNATTASTYATASPSATLPAATRLPYWRFNSATVAKHGV